LPWAKQYKDPGFKSWRCLLRWMVLTDDLLTVVATVPQWFPLVMERSREHRGEANILKMGESTWLPPTRGDRLSPQVFVRRMARVEIGITDPEKASAVFVVRRIVSWETGRFRSLSHQVTQ